MQRALHLITAAIGACGLAAGQPADPVAATAPTAPISTDERVGWAIQSTVGPQSLAAGAFVSGWGTLFNNPHEYGTHWDGFGARYGERMLGIAASKTVEAGLGAIWHEDPRYFRDPGAPFLNRVGHVVKMTFAAYGDDGHLHPAYARYIAISSTNYLSNTWRADSEAHVNDASMRIGLGLVGRMAGNAFHEFWPDIWHRHSTR